MSIEQIIGRMSNVSNLHPRLAEGFNVFRQSAEWLNRSHVNRLEVSEVNDGNSFDVRFCGRRWQFRFSATIVDTTPKGKISIVQEKGFSPGEFDSVGHLIFTASGKIEAELPPAFEDGAYVRDAKAVAYLVLEALEGSMH